MTGTMVSYSELARSLERIESPFTVAGAHGLLCGVLCADMGSGEGVWLGELGIGDGSTDALHREAAAAWSQVAERIRAQLCDPGLGFFLLLPEDGVLDEQGRTDALAQWCDGLLYGLGLSGLGGRQALPKLTREFLNDVAQISRASIGEEPDEGDEAAYVELVEYLRMGVLLINEELQPLKPPGRVQ